MELARKARARVPAAAPEIAKLAAVLAGALEEALAAAADLV